MNGILSGMPPGVLQQDPMMDPRTMAMMQMGLGLMSASGPSMTPVSLGSSIGKAGMQGLNAFQQLQQAQVAEAMKRRQMEMQEEQFKLAQADAQRKATMPVGHGPGTQLFRPGENHPFHTVPFRPEPTPEPRAPMTRKLRIGQDEVTQEYVNGEWKEVGRGPAFAKSVETPPKPAVAPRPPKDFEWTDDTYTEVRPIKGGPKDTAPRDAARAQGAVQKADTVIRKVDEALSQTTFSSTGLTGTVLGMVPGTKAYDLDKTIDTIKANLGFSELQAMREASPTGGALGQVAIQELAMLQSTVASLEKGQSEENLRRGLQQVRQHFQNWKNAVQQAQQGNPAPPAAPAAPQAAQPKRRTYNPKTGKFE